MNVTTEQLDHCQIKLIVQPDDALVQAALRKAAREISRNYQIPGFRKGKAPYAAVVRTYGKEVLYEQIMDDLGNDVYRQALEEAGIEPMAPGSLEDVVYDPLTFEYIVPMPPELELGNYRDMRVEQPEVEVSDEDVQAQLEEMQKTYAEWVPVEEEGAAYGDLVTMTIKGVSGEETIIDEEAFELILQEESEDFPPGFDEQFVGKMAGEGVAFDQSYPEDWPSERAGTEALFEAEVLSIKRYEAPELDDDFAPLIGEYDSLDELKDSIREGMLEQLQEAADNEYANEALSQIIDAAPKIDFPPMLVDGAVDRMVEEQSAELRRMGIPFDEYLRITGQSLESYRAALREPAEMRLKGDLVLEELVVLEGLEATDEEIEALGEELLEDSTDEESLRVMLESESGSFALAQTVQRRNVIERLMAIADGTAPPLDAAAEKQSVSENEVAEGTTELDTEAEKVAEEAVQGVDEPEASSADDDKPDEEEEAEIS